MKTPAATSHRSRFGIFTKSACALTAVLFLAGCPVTVSVKPTSPDVTLMVLSPELGSVKSGAGGGYDIEVKEQTKPVRLRMSRPNYFSYDFEFTPGKSNLALEELNLKLKKKPTKYTITSSPEGATVTFEGKNKGVTPLTLEVDFERSTPDADWPSKQVTLSRANYQSETVTLAVADKNDKTIGQTLPLPSTKLELLKEVREYTVAATNSELKPIITFNGKVIGKAPLKHTVTFERTDKTKAWPVFALSAELPGQYKMSTVELSFEKPRPFDVAFKLEVIEEIPVKIFTPEVRQKDTGAAYEMTSRTVLGVLRTGEDSTTTITDLKPVTRLGRQDDPDRPANRMETINSFTVTPDGQNVVFARSDTDDKGEGFSSLYIKKSDDVSGGVSRLVPGSYLDTMPFVANDGKPNLVFVSNRHDNKKSDISRIDISDNRLNGGVTRITNDNRFNFLPSYSDSNRLLFYLSIEPLFPKAEVKISYSRFDGSSATQLEVNAEKISYLNHSHTDRVYFVKTDPNTKKKQIYWITTDGRQETKLIEQDEFNKANCFQPYAHPDGKRILFVSDALADSKKRPNNDIFVVNENGSNIQRLTYNESDDTQPVWSPTKEGVLFFLSTRGGATNIWRCQIVSRQ